MKKILFAFLLIGTFIQCSKGDPSATFNLLSLEQNFGPQATQVPFEGQYTFFKDVSYGIKPQNKLDILLPSESDIKGVVLYFHGGAFLFGTKEDLYLSPSKEFVQALLAADIAVINADYTFINDKQSKGVLTALEEGTQVIRFAESNAALMGIPSQQIVLAGISAGAGIAQWNGFRNETNESIRGIVASFAKAVMNSTNGKSCFPITPWTAFEPNMKNWTTFSPTSTTEMLVKKKELCWIIGALWMLTILLFMYSIQSMKMLL